MLCGVGEVLLVKRTVQPFRVIEFYDMLISRAEVDEIGRTRLAIVTAPKRRRNWALEALVR